MNLAPKRLTRGSGWTGPLGPAGPIGLVVLAAFLAAACTGGGPASLGPAPGLPVSSPSPSATQSGGSPKPRPSPTQSSTSAKLFSYQEWFVRDGRLFETRRTAPFTPAVGALALTGLVAGPTQAESAAGVGTSVPGGTTLRITALAGGVATVQATPALPASSLGRAQVVYTLTQFSTIRLVRFSGESGSSGRAELGSLLPAILVEAPVVGQQVASPVTVQGTADVFEATVTIRVLDAAGRELARTFTTASCGTGCRGNYSIDVTYDVDHEQSGTIEVLDYSAKDGSPENVTDIPVILTP